MDYDKIINSVSNELKRGSKQALKRISKLSIGNGVLVSDVTDPMSLACICCRENKNILKSLSVNDTVINKFKDDFKEFLYSNEILNKLKENNFNLYNLSFLLSCIMADFHDEFIACEQIMNLIILSEDKEMYLEFKDFCLSRNRFIIFNKDMELLFLSNPSDKSVKKYIVFNMIYKKSINPIPLADFIKKGILERDEISGLYNQSFLNEVDKYISLNTELKPFKEEARELLEKLNSL